MGVLQTGDWKRVLPGGSGVREHTRSVKLRSGGGREWNWGEKTTITSIAILYDSPQPELPLKGVMMAGKDGEHFETAVSIGGERVQRREIIGKKSPSLQHWTGFEWYRKR